MTGADYTYFFDQYFKHSKIPTFEVLASQKGTTTTIRYRWVADGDGFRMPMKIRVGQQPYRTLTPTTTWQSFEIEGRDPSGIEIAGDEFYVEYKKTVSFVDPNRPEER
jgi:hypothetical protein